MGKKKFLKVVLDTNVVVSGLLFQGHLSEIHRGWKSKRFKPCLSKETFEELVRTLSYPKFSLSEDEIEYLLYEEVLPYFEVVEVNRDCSGASPDPEDDKFLCLAWQAKANLLVTGDKALLKLKRYKSTEIVSPSEFLRRLGHEGK